MSASRGWTAKNYARAKAGDSTAWMDPVIASKQNSALFSDHEMLAVDDAASGPRFGNVYVCDAAFRGTAEFIGKGNAAPEPIVLNYSSDGGDTWGHTQLSQAVNNGQISGRQDCAVNTDSKGNVYVFWDGIDPRTRTLALFMAVSADGGKHFSRPPTVVTHIDQTGLFDPASGDLTFDGVAGARDGRSRRSTSPTVPPPAPGLPIRSSSPGRMAPRRPTRAQGRTSRCGSCGRGTAARAGPRRASPRRPPTGRTSRRSQSRPTGPTLTSRT